MVIRRRQVMPTLVAVRNRLSSAAMAVRLSVEAHILWLKQELDDLDKGLRETLRRSPVRREKDDLLRSVPGIGEQISLTLLAYLPKLGTLNRRQVLPWWAWLPSIGTAALCTANAPSGVDGPESAQPSTWGRW